MIESLDMSTSANAESTLQRMQTLQLGLGSVETAAGGAERIFSELAENLPRIGVDFCGVVASSTNAAPSGDMHSFGGPADATRTRLLNCRRVVGELMSSRRFDLVASHFALYALPVLDRLRGKRFVVHFHGPWAAESQEEGAGKISVSVKRKLESLVYQRADRVITLSSAFAHLVQEEYGVRPEAIRIVPGCINIQRFAVSASKQEARHKLGWPLERKILVSVRRLTRRMGLDLLLDAMPEVIARFPDALLCIGGKGSLREQLEAKISALHLKNHVRLLGFIPEENLPLVYRAADLNIVPTRSLEGFGLVAAEALAAGTPSLVSPVGGLPEVVSALSPLLVLPSFEPVEIARKIVTVFSGEISLPTSEQCRAYAIQQFSSQAMAHKTAEVYRDLVGQASPS